MSKTATKAAKKTAARLTPIIVRGKTRQTFGTVTDLIDTLPTSRLKPLLTERGIGIPKTKPEMVARLSQWLCRDGGNFTLTLY